MDMTFLLLMLLLLQGTLSTGQSTQPAQGKNDTTVFCEILSNDGDSTRSAERRLIDYLFGARGEPKYLSSVRPKRNSLKAVDVSLQLSLLSINSLDDKNQELSTTGYIMMEWADEFLIWNPQDFENLTNVVIQPEMLWLPSDVGIENSVDAVYQSSFRTEFRAIVDSEGKVTWTPGGKISTACKLDVTFYPYDRQSCIISLSSWAYSDKHVHLMTSADRIDLKDYNVNGEWHIVDTKARSGVRYYGDPYSFVIFEISMQRKFYYHLINILLPCTIMSGLILLVFKLPAESGEKTGLGITILLSFSVFLLMIAESLPKTSDSLPIIGFYLTFLLIASSSSLLLTIIALTMHHASGEHVVPPYVRTTLRVLSVLTLTKSPRLSHTSEGKLEESDWTTPPPPPLSPRSIVLMGCDGYSSPLAASTPLPCREEPYKRRSHSADRKASERFCKSPYQVNYVITNAAAPSSTLPKATDRRKVLHETLLATQVAKSLDGPPPLPGREGCSELAKMQGNLKAYITELSSKMRQAEEEDEIRKDWKECSLCIDRVFFKLFSVLIGFSSFMMCLGLPIVLEFTTPNHW